MKKFLLIAAVAALSTVASYSQGLVSIMNTYGLVSTNNGVTIGRANGIGGYLFEMLYSSNTALPSTANNILDSANLALWTDSGVTGRNGTGATAGCIKASANAAVPGWTAPNITYDNERAFIIVGWSSDLGPDWTALADKINNGYLDSGFFGTTPVSFGYAGGGEVDLPSYNLWAGVTDPLLVLYSIPEPGTMALAALGGLSLLLMRRRK